MKKFLILSVLIHASIICSERTYPNPQVKLNLECINTDGNIAKDTYEAAYKQSIYSLTGSKVEFVDSKEIQGLFEKFFSLGKKYESKNVTQLQEKYAALGADYDAKLSKTKAAISNLKITKASSLIECLNSYSTPAKIGFGIAGVIVVTSLVYSGRQLYLFSTQKYSDWKANKKDSES